MSDKYSSLKVKELKDLIKKRDLTGDGKKEDLVNTLLKADELEELQKLEEELGIGGELDETKINLKDLDEDEMLKPIGLNSQAITESVLSDDDLFDEDMFKPIALDSKLPSKQTEKPTLSSKAASESVLSDDEADLYDVSLAKKNKGKKAAKVDDKNNKVEKVKVDEEESADKGTFVFKPIVFDKSEKTSLEESKRAQKRLLAERRKADEEKRVERLRRFGAAENSEDHAKTEKPPKAPAEPLKKPNPKSNTKPTSKSNTQQDALKKRAERFGLPVKQVKDTPESSTAASNKAKSNNNSNKPGQKKAGPAKNTQQRNKNQQSNNNNSNKRPNNGQPLNNQRVVINQVSKGRLIRNIGNKNDVREVSNPIRRLRNSNLQEQKANSNRNNNNNNNGQSLNIGGRSVTIGVLPPNITNRYQQRQRQPQQQQTRGQKRRQEQQQNNNKKRKH